MKVQNNSPKIYFPHQVNKNLEKPLPENGNKKIQHQQKLNIPKDFAPQKNLNRKEQVFFENLFPEAKKEIQVYLQQQNKTVPEKGKFIDMKG